MALNPSGKMAVHQALSVGSGVGGQGFIMLDLFSGIGGARLGFDKARVPLAGAAFSETDPTIGGNELGSYATVGGGCRGCTATSSRSRNRRLSCVPFIAPVNGTSLYALVGKVPVGLVLGVSV